MATSIKPSLCRRLAETAIGSKCPRWQHRRSCLRSFQTKVTQPKFPEYGFAFDIDGVLVRSSEPIPAAKRALSYLQDQNIPFVLITNGGGRPEEDRVQDLQDKLGIKLDAGMLVQSHTPFRDLHHYKDKTVFVSGGDSDTCRRVAENYGFRTVITAADILCAHPEIWPFGKQYLDLYAQWARPLPHPIKPSDPTTSLRIDGPILVMNDPRDWALDSTIILDLLMSRSGILGTLSPKNGNPDLPNAGWQQDSQPHLYYSNLDLWWASSYHQNRLGQGAFLAAFEGLWKKVTQKKAELQYTAIGKPVQATFAFAENLLRLHRKKLFGNVGLNDPLRRVYMVGDNPESDIRGANEYRSEFGSEWRSVLVETGVFKKGGSPSYRPDVVVGDVEEGVRWAVEDAGRR